MKKGKTLKFGAAILSGEMLLGASFVVLSSYISFCYTDIGHVSPEMMGTAMFFVSLLGGVWSLFSGALVQNTRTKGGMYRPWLIASSVGMGLTGFLLMFNLSSMLVNCIVISIGFFLGNCFLDPWAVSKYGIYEKISQGETDKRTLFSGLSYAGGNLGFVIYGAFFLTLVAVLGGVDQTKGFLYTHAIFVVMGIVGAFIISALAKPYDADNRSDAGEKETVNLKEMFGSVIKNRLIVVVGIGNIIRYAGNFSFLYLLIYLCNSVLEDIMAYSVAMVVVSVAGVVGALIAPWLIGKLGGRKKSAIIIAIAYGLCYVALGFFGKTYMGLMVTLALCMVIQNAYDSIDMMMYLDAGEVWYNKTGQDTRAFCMNVSNLVSKLGTALSSLALAGVLGAIDYSEGAVLDAAGKSTLTMASGLLPGVCAFAFALLLIFFHNVSDKEIERCITENAVKDGVSEGLM